MLRLVEKSGNWAHSPVRNRLRSLKETADICGISLQTLRRLIDAGNGPKVTRISPQRLGIRDDHREQWLDSRVLDMAKA